MYLYFFVLGNHPALSLAEIESLLAKENIQSSFIEINREICILQTAQTIAAHELQHRLGGTVKIGHILTTSSARDITPENAARWCEPFLSKERKNILGVSWYAADALPSVSKNFPLSLKSLLKKDGHSIRVLENKTPALTSVQIGSQQVLSKGLELVFIGAQDKIYVGKTETIQDYAAYSERDFGRPNRDDYSGMLPPKLARILLNLAQIDKNSVLLDPFCGSGTVVTEAMDLGVTRILASDVSPRAIQDTNKNVEWFAKRSGSNSLVSIMQHDATLPFPFAGADCVVSELYLGPPSLPRGGSLEKVKAEIASLLCASVRSLAGMQSPPKKIVLAIPRFKVAEQWEEIDYSGVQKIGYTIQNPLSKKIAEQFPQELSSRQNLVYARPTARVGREILLLCQ